MLGQLASPEVLEPPPQTIAGHRGFLEPGYDQSHPRMARLRRRPENVEVRSAGAAAGPEDQANVEPADQPMRARKALAVGQTRACFEPMDTVRRFRPFLRRRDSTARPHRSSIRLRNPCLATRRLLRGL